MDKFLAPFLDKFKASNPRVWAMIVLLLSVIEVSITKGSFFSLFPVEGVIADILHWVSWALALLVGSRTTNILKPELQNALTVALAEAETHKSNLDELHEDYNALHEYRNTLESDYQNLQEKHAEVTVQKDILTTELANFNTGGRGIMTEDPSPITFKDPKTVKRNLQKK
jgi:hypothetical protein